MVALLLIALATAQVAPGPVDAGPPDPLDEVRALWGQRLDPKALDSMIVRLEALHRPEATLLTAHAHRFRALAFELRRRPLAREKGIADLESARELALKAWNAEQPGASAQVARGELTGALASADNHSLPALLELAQADLALAGWRRPVQAVTLLHESLAAATRAEALDANSDFETARRIRGAVLAALPPLTGGDLVASRFEFERAIANAPSLLANRVEMAARYAVKAQNRRLFHALLVTVLRIDPEAIPELEPEQRLERARALGLLHRERELFRG